ncbi:hypothetical protein [Arthrobacter celericrescens]|uniref:hypothetical protein n=1 Tax=Arthrobacter celericrescens TaxID=2320851 RepID=UPI0013C4FE0E|nr:hypothetical protein [Arthrobacter celericrescens]
MEYLTGRRQMLGRSAAPSLYGNRDALEELKARVAPDLSMLPTGFRDARRLGSSTGKWSVVSRRLGLRLHVQDFDGLLADTLHRLSFPEAVVVTDQVIPAERGSARAGERCTRSKEHLAALCAALGKGAQRERMAAVLAFADPLSESVGESYSRAVIAKLGFELPELQFRVLGASGEVARTDFHWRERKLVGEFDGLMKYTRARELSGKTAAQVTEEKLREDRIRELDYGVVRWVWDEVMNPERLAAKLLRAGVPRRTR